MFCCGIFLMACNTATPEKNFDVAVLNTNVIVGFAGSRQLRNMEPSPALDDKGKVVSMTRENEVLSKIKFVEESLGKIKKLGETDDNRDIVQASLALYNYVLPVYKTEYMQLATLYDQNASEETIDAAAQAIGSKHAASFEALYGKLIAAGKVYASKHNIKVNWAE